MLVSFIKILFNILYVYIYFLRPVEDVVEFLELVTQVLQLRARHSTLVHTDSSRSHLVITLTITIKAASEDDFGKKLVYGILLIYI